MVSSLILKNHEFCSLNNDLPDILCTLPICHVVFRPPMFSPGIHAAAFSTRFSLIFADFSVIVFGFCGFLSGPLKEAAPVRAAVILFRSNRLHRGISLLPYSAGGASGERIRQPRPRIVDGWCLPRHHHAVKKRRRRREPCHRFMSSPASDPAGSVPPLNFPSADFPWRLSENPWSPAPIPSSPAAP